MHVCVIIPVDRMIHFLKRKKVGVLTELSHCLWLTNVNVNVKYISLFSCGGTTQGQRMGNLK